MFPLVSALLLSVAASGEVPKSLADIQAQAKERHQTRFKEAIKNSVRVERSESDKRTLATSSGSWVNDAMYWKDDCSSSKPLMSGENVEACYLADTDMSIQLMGCTSNSTIITVAFDAFISNGDCSGKSDYSSDMYFNAECEYGFQSFCDDSAKLQDWGEKQFGTDDCASSALTGYMSYSNDACIAGYYKTDDCGASARVYATEGCSGASAAWPTGDDAGDGVCHNAANTDDGYFDDNWYDGNRFEYYAAQQSYCNSAASLIPSVGMLAVAAAGVFAVLF